ncbi:hypothetical protein [Thiohalospira sp.]|uniref:hypothetical protein n=1 Tax=Thiohalospira sp. TaxID=3080549 RepID=UPI003980203B
MPRHGYGQGHGKGQGGGRGPGGDPERRQRHRHDQSVFHELLDRHDAIHRELETIPGGIRTETTSDDPEVVALLHDHVPAMHQRLQEGFALRRWDPLYVALFEHRDRITMAIELTDNGVRVEETSDAPEVTALIRAHGQAVNAFAARGHDAASQPSPMPDETP